MVLQRYSCQIHKHTMAHGFGRHLLHADKNVEKFAYFRENLINYYKWNLKSASFAVLFLAAIPVGLSYVGYKYQTVNKVAERRNTPIFTEYVPRS